MLKSVLFVPDFGINILAVKYVASKKQDCALLFLVGAELYDKGGNLIGRSQEPVYHTHL